MGTQGNNLAKYFRKEFWTDNKGKTHIPFENYGYFTGNTFYSGYTTGTTVVTGVTITPSFTGLTTGGTGVIIISGITIFSGVSITATTILYSGSSSLSGMPQCNPVSACTYYSGTCRIVDSLGNNVTIPLLGNRENYGAYTLYVDNGVNGNSIYNTFHMDGSINFNIGQFTTVTQISPSSVFITTGSTYSGYTTGSTNPVVVTGITGNTCITIDMIDYNNVGVSGTTIRFYQNNGGTQISGMYGYQLFVVRPNSGYGSCGLNYPIWLCNYPPQDLSLINSFGYTQVNPIPTMAVSNFQYSPTSPNAYTTYMTINTNFSNCYNQNGAYSTLGAVSAEYVGIICVYLVNGTRMFSQPFKFKTQGSGNI